MEHYLQVTEDHFAQALQGGAKAAQNPAQSAHEMGGKEHQAQKKTPVFSEKHGGLRPYTTGQVGGARFELATSTV